MSQNLLIGEVTTRTGLNPKTIRYYEEVGLIPKPRRKRAGYASPGYRLYSEHDVERLRFIKGARLLDLSLAEIKQLLPYLNGQSARQHLDLAVERKLAAIDAKIKDLQLLRDRLQRIKNVIPQGNREVQEKCCDPLCGPEICPPPLVQIAKPRGVKARTNSSSRR